LQADYLCVMVTISEAGNKGHRGKSIPVHRRVSR